MFRLFTFACSFILAFSTHSLAGTPIEETVTCPVGGEQFTITGTASCSTMGRTMSFRPLSSCDFVTKLPVCPANGLPMYEEFSETQIAELTAFITTDRFEGLKELPPWQRAYGVAQYLGQDGTDTGFNLLLNAIWFETDEFFASSIHINHFLRELDQILIRSDNGNTPYFNAIAAYVLSTVGRTSEANERLNSAAETPDAAEYLLQYISAIKSCQPDMAREGCRPYERFAP